MNGYLLDTHTVLWWLGDKSSLSKTAQDVIADPGNAVYVSAAVAWEITIKQARGRLEAPDDFIEVLQENSFIPLPITVPHALAVAQLPDHHQDPFDRVMIAQAIAENLTLVTRDGGIEKYDVERIKA